MRQADDPRFLELIDEEVLISHANARDEARQKAKEEIARIQEENTRYYNKRRKEATKYKVGDLVAIKRTQFGGGLKLCIKFLGSYRIRTVKPKDDMTSRK